MISNSSIRQVNALQREMRALKTQQLIPGSAIKSQTARLEFSRSFNLNSVAGANRVSIGSRSATYSESMAIYLQAIDPDTGQPTDTPAISPTSVQFKFSGDSWDNPIAPLTTAINPAYSPTGYIAGTLNLHQYQQTGGTAIWRGRVTIAGLNQLPALTVNASTLTTGGTFWKITRMTGVIIWSSDAGEITSQNFDWTG